MACPGVYKPGPGDNKGTCYTYEILSSICFEIGYSVAYELGTESWEYRGGCYEHDSPALYERATPGRIYEFDFIPIEVRADDDPFTVVSKTGSINGGSDLSFFGWLSWVALSLAIISATVFVVSLFTLKRMNR